jgi:4-amino-4-deoxy-L-arabinose transferase-like glycosyltransferase
MKENIIYRTIALHCCIFAVLAWFCLPNLNHDMLENYAWGQTFEWGSFKHPPLFSWITRWWFMVWPTTPLAYYVLSYLNNAFALLGIVFLSKQLIGNEHPRKEYLQLFLFMVLFFSLLTYPYSLYAVKFNADTILFSLWPWTAFSFLASLEASESFKKWLWTLLFSILAAASMLSKYFSVVLLFTLFIISLAEPSYRRWYKTVYPYTGLAFFLLLLIPHIVWEIRMDFPFRSYTSRYFADLSENHSFWAHFLNVINFSLSGIYYFFVAWIAWFFLRWQIPKSNAVALISGRQHRILNYLCFFPVGIVILSALVFNIQLMERWATSLWFALPILMVNLLSRQGNLSEIPLIFIVKKLTYFWIFIAVLVLSFTVYVSLFQAHKENRLDYAEASKEMAVAVARQFQKKFPGKEFTWISGFSWPDHPAALAFYLPTHPRAIPFFPDQMPALVNPHTHWNREYGAIICGKNIKDNEQLITHCIKQTHLWLTMRNLPIEQETITYQARGWRYVKPVEKEAVVFWIPPER